MTNLKLGSFFSGWNWSISVSYSYEKSVLLMTLRIQQLRKFSISVYRLETTGYI